jgi:stress-induced morphogen
MTGAEIEKRIKAAIPDAVIALTDLAGDDDHWQVEVTSASFAGKPRVMQHKAVMNAIGKDDMGTTLHALSITTKAPA